MYKKALCYFKKGNFYLDGIAKGLFDSKFKYKYSNEFFKKEKLKSLDRVISVISEAVNNYLINKCFFYRKYI